MSVKIITDAISDISAEVADEYGIEVMPIEIKMDGKRMMASDISVLEMVEWIEKNKKVPEFSGVSGDQYAEAFQRYVNEGNDIVCITAGSSAISNYDCACYASTKFPDSNIFIINTMRFSGNVGFLSVKAAKMAREGISAQQIAATCERSIDMLRQTALMDSMDFLKYAGAVPKIVAAGTNLFNAKFAFAMSKDDERDAEIVGYSMPKALKNFCSKVFKNLRDIKPELIFLTYTLADEDYISQVLECVKKLAYFQTVIVCTSSHFNTSFVGRNCMTVTYQMK
ncbi:MAG: DegV family protein [Eubacteriales bacterium]